MAATTFGGGNLLRPARGRCAQLRCEKYSQVRILTIVADEGSTGWALFQFLSNRVGLRVLFVRDPFHRFCSPSGLPPPTPPGGRNRPIL